MIHLDLWEKHRKLMDDFLQAMDQISNVLYRIEKRRQARSQAAQKLPV